MLHTYSDICVIMRELNPPKKTKPLLKYIVLSQSNTSSMKLLCSFRHHQLRDKNNTWKTIIIIFTTQIITLTLGMYFKLIIWVVKIMMMVFHVLFLSRNWWCLKLQRSFIEEVLLWDKTMYFRRGLVFLGGLSSLIITQISE
jgi:hypothetical protein